MEPEVPDLPRRGVIGAALAVALGIFVVMGILFGPLALAETYGGLNGIGLIAMVVFAIVRARRGRGRS